MLGPRAVTRQRHPRPHRATPGPLRATALMGRKPDMATFRPTSTGWRLAAVEAELDHAGGDLAGTVAARVAGDARVWPPGRRGGVGRCARRRGAPRRSRRASRGGRRRRPRCGTGRRARRRSPAPPRSAPRPARSPRPSRRPASGSPPVEISSRWPPTISVSPSRSRRGRSSGSPFSAVPLRLSRSVAISTCPRTSISRWFQETASSSSVRSASGERPTTVRSIRQRHRPRRRTPRRDPDPRIHGADYRSTGRKALYISAFRPINSRRRLVAVVVGLVGAVDRDAEVGDWSGVSSVRSTPRAARCRRATFSSRCLGRM